MADTVYETEIAVRYRDIDAMGHVNNAVYATYSNRPAPSSSRESSRNPCWRLVP